MKTLRVFLLVLTASLVGAVICAPQSDSGREKTMTITVGPADADVLGTDNVAIQKAIDRVAAAGGGTVIIKAGVYTLHNSVRLASHLTLRGEGTDKTILQKDPGVRSRLKLDADYGEFQATVADARPFAPGMGVTIVDKAVGELVRRTPHALLPASSWYRQWRALGFRSMAVKDANSRYRPGEASPEWSIAAIPER